MLHFAAAQYAAVHAAQAHRVDTGIAQRGHK